jgi:hypothetical protein
MLCISTRASGPDGLDASERDGGSIPSPKVLHSREVGAGLTEEE